jgi:glutathione S-transferase
MRLDATGRPQYSTYLGGTGNDYGRAVMAGAAGQVAVAGYTTSLDFPTAINSKGAVPALRLDNGQVLTEGVAIMQYLADQKPESNLAPRNGTLERYRLQEWLNYVTSEVHKTFSPLWNPAAGDQVHAYTRANLEKKFDWLDAQLAGRKFLTGDTFTIADAYLFTVVNWTSFLGIDLGKWPALRDFQARVAARPKVQEAMAAEGLLKKAA